MYVTFLHIKSPSQNSIELWIIFHFIKLWHLSTTLTSTPITKVPDRLWDETSTVLSREKPDNALVVQLFLLET